MDEITLYFNTNLSHLRKIRGLTQAELAKRVGFTQAAISRWENGLQEPAIGDVARIAAFFDVDIDHLAKVDMRNL